MFNFNLSLFIIVMKKVFRSTALLFLCTTMYAQDISQTMSMNLQNVTLKEFFKNLEAQTSFSVVYRDIILSENPDVVVSASNRPLKDILSQVLEKHGLSYKVSNKTIVIVKAEAQAPVKQRKTKKISGVITDETGKSRKTKSDGREKRKAIFEAKTKCAPKIRVALLSVRLSGQNTSVVQTPFESCLNDAFLLKFPLKYHLKLIANSAEIRIFT